MKRFYKKYIVLVTSVATLFSCAELDDNVDTGIKIEKPVSVIVDDIVSNYDVLKSYSGDLVLGANVSLDDMSASGAMTTLLVTNFEQVTPSTELNSDVIISGDGVFDFTAIDTYISKAEELGLSVYGDAIVSNLNQNDTLLSTVGASLTYLTPLYPNRVNSAPIEDETFTNWTVKGDLSVEEYMGEPSLKMVNGASVSASDATSLQSPVYTVEENSKFEMTFYLLSTQVGEGRVTFTGLNNNAPELDWMGTGTASSTFTTKIGWNEIKFQTDDFDGSGEFSFEIELGYTSNVTYFMNIKGLSLINLNGSVEDPDQIFLECEDADQIGQWMITQNDNNASGGKTIVGIINGDIEADDTGGGNPADANNQDLQFTYTFNVRTSGTYRLWLRQKAHVADNGYDSFFISVDGANYYCPGWPGWGDDSNTVEWTWMKLYTNSSDKDGSSLFNLDVGEHTVSFRIREGGHYFDKIYFTMLTSEPSGLGTAVIEQEEVTLEVSDDVRKFGVEYLLNDYVINILTNLSEKISAWTVVKNPFAEDGNVAVSGGTSVEGTYYWADYIGRDYIAQSFSVAKENVTDGTLLFIGETDLNDNSAKRNAVINSLNEVSDIDGIAVSLNLSLDADLDAVENMFVDLVATGKLIYLSNLSVSVTEETDESYALQSEVFKAVVDLYKSMVPDLQQYGISLAQPAGDNLGLWDSGYNRKLTYVGFVEGLGAEE